MSPEADEPAAQSLPANGFAAAPRPRAHPLRHWAMVHYLADGDAASCSTVFPVPDTGSAVAQFETAGVGYRGTEYLAGQRRTSLRSTRAQAG